MVVWIKQSLKKFHANQAATEEVKTEIGELQDAVVELAGIVSDIADEGGNQNG